MNKREAKRWACGMIADLASADLNAGYIPDGDEPDREIKKCAMQEVIYELMKRGGTYPKEQSPEKETQ